MPMSDWLRELSITIMINVHHPAVLSGFGAAENNLHAPNENMPVDRFGSFQPGQSLRPACIDP